MDAHGASRCRLSLLGALFLVGCGYPPPEVAEPPAPTATPRDATETPAEAPELKPRMRVLWRDPAPPERVLKLSPDAAVSTTHHLLTLLGADPRGEHAYLVRSPLGNEDWFEVVDVPLSEGSPSHPPRQRWIGASGVRFNDFGAFGGDATQNLLRYAAILEEIGPFVTRRQEGSAPNVAVSKDALLYEGRQDDLYLSDRQGGHAHKIIAANAAYNPQFSADGRAFAFTGCHSVPPVPGKWHQCEYHLYISGPEDKTPARIAKVIDPQPPVLSLDGRYVYAASRDQNYEKEPKDRGGCLYRVDVAPPHTATELWCSDKHERLTFSLSPDGKTAVIEGTLRESKDHALEVTWVSLPDGAKRGQASIPFGSGDGALTSSGLYATRGRQGFAYADLATGKVVVLPEPTAVFTLLSRHFLDSDSVLATREIAGRTPMEEVVAINLRVSVETPE